MAMVSFKRWSNLHCNKLTRDTPVVGGGSEMPSDDQVRITKINELPKPWIIYSTLVFFFLFSSWSWSIRFPLYVETFPAFLTLCFPPSSLPVGSHSRQPQWHRGLTTPYILLLGHDVGLEIFFFERLTTYFELSCQLTFAISSTLFWTGLTKLGRVEGYSPSSSLILVGLDATSNRRPGCGATLSLSRLQAGREWPLVALVSRWRRFLLRTGHPQPLKAWRLPSEAPRSFPHDVELTERLELHCFRCNHRLKQRPDPILLIIVIMLPLYCNFYSAIHSVGENCITLFVLNGIYSLWFLVWFSWTSLRIFISMRTRGDLRVTFDFSILSLIFWPFDL